MIMNFLKTFFFIFFIFLSFYLTDVKGELIEKLEDKNQTTIGSNETVDEGFIAANKTGPCEPNPCKNGGSCLETDDASEGFTCKCTILYMGAHCEDDICELCGKDKVCEIGPSGDVRCYVKKNITEPKGGCENLTCANNGVCMKLINNETCICRIGFKGKQCEEIDKNERTCIWYFRKCEETGGYCTSDGNNTHPCICPDGTRYIHKQGCIAIQSITNCTSDTRYCERWGGYCTRNIHREIQCICPEELRYEYNWGCVSRRDAVNCSLYLKNCEETGGYCTSDTYGRIQCKCQPIATYEPKYGCRKLCTDGLCENGGTCIVEKGKSKCLCKDPFAGKFCEIDLCRGNICKNGGICGVDQGEAKCFCKEPYGGKYCDILMDNCATNICGNGGLCRKIAGETKCFCMEPYSGKFCDTPRGRPNLTMPLAVFIVVGVVLSSIVTSIICLCCFRKRPEKK